MDRRNWITPVEQYDGGTDKAVDEFTATLCLLALMILAIIGLVFFMARYTA